MLQDEGEHFDRLAQSHLLRQDGTANGIGRSQSRLRRHRTCEYMEVERCVDTNPPRTALGTQRLPLSGGRFSLEQEAHRSALKRQQMCEKCARLLAWRHARLGAHLAATETLVYERRAADFVHGREVHLVRMFHHRTQLLSYIRGLRSKAGTRCKDIDAQAYIVVVPGEMSVHVQDGERQGRQAPCRRHEGYRYERFCACAHVQEGSVARMYVYARLHSRLPIRHAVERDARVPVPGDAGTKVQRIAAHEHGIHELVCTLSGIEGCIECRKRGERRIVDAPRHNVHRMHISSDATARPAPCSSSRDVYEGAAGPTSAAGAQGLFSTSPIMSVLTGAIRVAAASSGARAMLMKRAAVPAAMQGMYEA